MKKLAILAMTILAINFTSCSDDDDAVSMSEVPNEVTLAFETQFPEATDVDYETFNDQYEVDFDLNNVDYEALYDMDGTLVKYKYDILDTDVPQEILTAIINEYDDRPIDDAEILVIDGTNYYQIELDNTPTDDQILFNTDGTVNTTIAYWDS